MSKDFTEISAQRIYEHVEKFVAIGPREDGTVADNQAADYVFDTLNSLGLDAQRMRVPCWVIEPITASIKVTRPEQIELKCGYGNLTGVTQPEGVKGELVFVDKGFEDDFKGKDLKGKVALAWQERYWEAGDQPRRKMARAAQQGAVGIIFVMKRRDDLITCWGLGREPGLIPFITISYPDLLMLRRKMKAGAVEVEIKVLGEPKMSESQVIWTVIPGTENPDEMVGFGACHHETVPLCPGANDNASAQSMLLELARFFQNHPQKRSVLLMSNGGEEGGLWGAGSFVESNKDWLVKSLKSMIMIDQVGGMEPLVFSGTTEWLEKAYVEEANKLGYQLTHCFDPLVMTARDGLGDALPFVNAGIPTIFAVAWPTDFFYHTSADTADKVSANGIKAVTDFTASLLMRLAAQ